MRIQTLIFTIFLTISTNIFAEQNSWDISVGQTGKFKYSFLGGDTTGYRSDFNEKFISIAYNHGFNKYISAYGKVFHYQGNSTADKEWNRTEQEWKSIDSPFDTNGTYFGAGLKAHTDQEKKLSASIHLGYGYLNNPDNILNSGHQQFNLGADITLKTSEKWSFFVNWEHISNGRQFFSLGKKESDLYPNNGRDFFGIGARYTR